MLKPAQIETQLDCNVTCLLCN